MCVCVCVCVCVCQSVSLSVSQSVSLKIARLPELLLIWQCTRSGFPAVSFELVLPPQQQLSVAPQSVIALVPGRNEDEVKDAFREVRLELDEITHERKQDQILVVARMLTMKHTLTLKKV